MTELTRLIRGFAELLKPSPGNDAKLTEWITAVRACGPPHLHAFTNGAAHVPGCRTYQQRNSDEQRMTRPNR
jgi:fatty-acid desaturase